MSAGDTSYPPFLYALPNSHDLKLVGTVTGNLTVDFTWDSDGKATTIDYGDGNSDTGIVSGQSTHIYAANGQYTAKVNCPRATDSADINLAAAEPPPETPEPEPETETFTAIPVDQSDDSE